MAHYLMKNVGAKKWLWFKNTNNYFQLEEGVFLVFEKIQNTESLQKVVQWCAKCFPLDETEAEKTVNIIHSFISDQMNGIVTNKKITALKALIPNRFYSAKIYRFNGVDFCLFYGDDQIETMFHPLFAHLKTTDRLSDTYIISLFKYNGKYVLVLDDVQIGIWTKDEDHLFKGQVFMALLNKAYSKSEKDWLGVLHASAIGDNQNCVLFLGDSGNGKSTASAIALANGFSLVADDFVPITTSGRAFAFPAAISIKKQAVDILSKDFPELLKAKEYELKAMNKTVRYLPSKNLKNHTSRTVKAFIFIKHNSEIDFEFKLIDKHLAFQYLVVDSWLSPEEENARFFMDWMADLPAYSLQYSNNQKMLNAIQNLVINE